MFVLLLTYHLHPPENLHSTQPTFLSLTALRDDDLLNCDFQPVLSIDSSPTLLAGLLELPSYRVMFSEVAKRKTEPLYKHSELRATSLFERPLERKLVSGDNT